MTDVVGNLVAEPPATEKPSVGQASGRLRFACDSITIPLTFDTAADTIALMRIPTNARIYSVELMFTGAIDTGASLTLDLGFYQDQPNVAVADALVAVDQNALGTLLTDGQAVMSAFVEFRFETLAEVSANLPVWDLCTGITADPGGNYILALTAVTAAATPAASTLEFRCLYSVD